MDGAPGIAAIAVQAKHLVDQNAPWPPPDTGPAGMRDLVAEARATAAA